MCCADTEAWLYSSVFGESLGPSHRKSRQPRHQEPHRSGESAVAVLGIKVMKPLTPRWECVCVCVLSHGQNALDHAENLTALGFHLARLPVEPHIGKLILFGALLGCLDPVLTIAASLSFKDPFFIPLVGHHSESSASEHTLIPAACFSQGKEKMADMRRKVLSRNSKSDHLTIINAFQVLRLSPASFLSHLPIVWIDPALINHWLIG